jgi:hypothetical protein
MEAQRQPGFLGLAEIARRTGPLLGFLAAHSAAYRIVDAALRSEEDKTFRYHKDD